LREDASLIEVTADERRWLRDLFAGRDAAPPADLAPLLRATREHGLQPLLFTLVHGDWPRELVDALRRDAFGNAMLAERGIVRMTEVVEALRAHEITPLFIKGTALAESIYPSRGLRPRADVDLIVAPSEAERAVDALRALGYVAEMSPRNAPSAQVMLRGSHAGDVLDLHWAISNARELARLFDVDALRANGTTTASGLRIPATVDSLLIACVHRVAHHHGDDRLIWLYDLVLLWRALTPDERRLFRQRAVEGEIVAICADGLSRAFEWFASDEAPAFERTSHREQSESFLDPQRLHISELIAELRAAKGKRLRFLRLLAFPSAEQMRARFPGASNVALPFLYLRRALGAVAKLFTRVRG
jgi:hypothetical protein